MAPIRRVCYDLCPEILSITTLPKKILIVRLGALGDVANALVLAAAIKRAAPDTFVGWAVHNLALPIVEGNPVVDRAYLWDKKLGVRGLIFWVLGFDRARTKEFAWLFLNESIAPLPKSAFKPWHIGEQYLESATHLRIEASAEHRLHQAHLPHASSRLHAGHRGRACAGCGAAPA